MKSTTMTYIPYIIIGLPIVMTLLIYYVMLRIQGVKWKAIHTSVQWSAIFYMIAVAFLLKMIVNQSVLGYILILLIIMLSIILIIQWKKEMDVVLTNGIRLLLRVSFLLFFILYVGLLTYILIRFILLQVGS
ncbi:MAG TPA: DUF3397 family protein [Pseudogracilibacillus sp.]|nr:DUF3397 family protein [Pseudogracilibacillus sp.]